MYQWVNLCTQLLGLGLQFDKFLSSAYMKYLPNGIFEGEASEVLLLSQAHFVMCLVERGFILKVNS